MTRDELVEKLAWLSIGSESHDETEQLWDAAAMLRADGEEIERLRAALKFYADKDHFNLSEPDAWDTVSDEPSNWWCDEEGTATVEDGTFARMALEGKPLPQEPQ